MIYALVSVPTPKADREDLARHILGHQDVAPFVHRGLIIHIMHAISGGAYYCIYCEDELRLSRVNRPATRVPANDWVLST